MSERRDRLYAELGVPPEDPEDPLDAWRRMRAEREEPEPLERDCCAAGFRSGLCLLGVNRVEPQCLRCPV